MIWVVGRLVFLLVEGSLVISVKKSLNRVLLNEIVEDIKNKGFLKVRNYVRILSFLKEGGEIVRRIILLVDEKRV